MSEIRTHSPGASRLIIGTKRSRKLIYPWPSPWLTAVLPPNHAHDKWLCRDGELFCFFFPAFWDLFWICVAVRVVCLFHCGNRCIPWFPFIFQNFKRFLGVFYAFHRFSSIFQWCYSSNFLCFSSIYVCFSFSFHLFSLIVPECSLFFTWCSLFFPMFSWIFGNTRCAN